MLGEQRESTGEASNYSLRKHWLSNYEERRNIQILSDYPSAERMHTCTLMSLVIVRQK